MRLKFLNFLAFMLIGFYAVAQTANVSGHIYAGFEPGAEEGMPGYPVALIVSGGGVIETVTDDDGAYSIDFIMDADADPIGTISIFDFCFGETATADLLANGGTEWVIDMVMCDDNPVDPPVACDAFFIDEQISVEPYVVAFTDVSYAEPAATSWAWDFGDGGTSDEQNPTHEYAAAGGYDVSFTITTDSCTSTIVYGILVQADIEECDCVLDWAPICVATLGGDTLSFPNLCFAECVGFTADDIVDCDWGNPCNCTDEWAPVCVDLGDGLIVDFPNACWAECEGYTADDFVDCEPDGCNCTYEWAPVCVDLGDGLIVDFPNACLAECEGYTADDFVDCENLGGYDCYADFYTDFFPFGGNGLEMNFMDGSYANEGEITSWAWDFGDGNTSDEQNPTHTYAEEGIYEVILTITTSEDCTSSTVLHICIGNEGGYEGPDCQAMFFFTQTDIEGFAFGFEDFSIGEAVSWTWDFGDGETSDEQNPAHAYAEGGVYLVTLSISTADGDCESSTTMPIFVNEDAFYEDECWALFMPLIEPENNTVFFLDMSSPGTIETHWDFGDGTTSDEPFAAIHEYADGGTYTVTLSIITGDGCESTFEVEINIAEDDFVGNPQYSLTTGTDDVNVVSKVNTYPNPVANTLNVEFNTTEAGAYSINMTAIDGRTIQTVNGEAVKGINTTTLNTTALPQGIYFVNIQSGTATTTFRVVKD